MEQRKNTILDPATNIKRVAPQGSILYGEAIPLSGNTERLIALMVLTQKNVTSDLTLHVAKLFNYQIKTHDMHKYMVINGVGVDVIRYLIERLGRELYDDPRAYKYDMDVRDHLV